MREDDRFLYSSKKLRRSAPVIGSDKAQAGLLPEASSKERMEGQKLEHPPVFEVVEGSYHLTLAERIIGPRRGAALQPAAARVSKEARQPSCCPPLTTQGAAVGRRTRSVGRSCLDGSCGRAVFKGIRARRRAKSQPPLLEKTNKFSVIRIRQAALQPAAMIPAASRGHQPVWPTVQPTRFSAGSRINCSRETTAEELHTAANRPGPLLPAMLGPSQIRGRELQRRSPVDNNQQTQLQVSEVTVDGLDGSGDTGPLHFTPKSAEVQREPSPRLPSVPPFVTSFPVHWYNRLPPSGFSTPFELRQQLIPVDVSSVPVPEAREPRADASRFQPFAHIAAQRSTDSLFVGDPGEVIAHGLGWLPALDLQGLNQLPKVEEESPSSDPQQADEEEQEFVQLHFSPGHDNDSMSTASCDHTSRLVEGICEELFNGEDDEYEYGDDDDFYSDSGDTLFSEFRFQNGRGDGFNCLMPSRGAAASQVRTPRNLSPFHPGFVRAEGYPNNWRRLREEHPAESHPNNRHQARGNHSVVPYPQESYQDYSEGSYPQGWQQTYAEYPVHRCPNVEHQILRGYPEHSYSSSWHREFAAGQRYPNNWNQRHEDFPVNRYPDDWDRTLEENRAEEFSNDWRQLHQDQPVQRFSHNCNRTHEEYPFTYPSDYPLDQPMPFDFRRQDCSSAGDDNESWDGDAFEENFPEVYQTPLGTIESIDGLVMYRCQADDSYNHTPSSRGGNELVAPMISRRHLVDYLAEQIIPRHSNHDDIEAYAAIRPTKLIEDLVFTGEEATHIIHTVLLSGCLPWHRSREDVEVLVDHLIEHYLETSCF
ncbi:hypothetical protein Esti_001064 [Eimeria stiedai]